MGGDGWGDPEPDEHRLATVTRALEGGITCFDTAPSYGGGASERLLGRALKHARARVAIATKVGPRDDPRESLEGSLRRLDTDYVDLVLLHEALDGWERRLEQLRTLAEEGKARAVGLCNATHAQLARALEIVPLAAYQGPYNLFDRDAEQRHLPLCRERHVAFLAYRPLAAGLLAGRYERAPRFPATDHRRGIYWFKGREFTRRQTVIARLRPIARRLDVPLPGLALAWVLAQPDVTVALAGARTPGQVEENLAGTRPLAPDVVAAIDAVVADVFRLPRATPDLVREAAGWGERERFIVARLDGSMTADGIAAEWTDGEGTPMIAAQVMVFCDQLAERGLVITDD